MYGNLQTLQFQISTRPPGIEIDMMVFTHFVARGPVVATARPTGPTSKDPARPAPDGAWTVSVVPGRASIDGMDRRRFLQAGVFTAGGTAALPLVATAAGAQSAGVSPYGSIEGIAPDENGVILPAGFTSRIVAVAGEMVGLSLIHI